MRVKIKNKAFSRSFFKNRQSANSVVGCVLIALPFLKSALGEGQTKQQVNK
jgi:hypothetical protein